VRSFGKYPPDKYPAFARLLAERYEVDPAAAADRS
jgi:hypothetical protein